MHLRLASHREHLAWREGESESAGREQLVMEPFSCLDSMHLLLGVLTAWPASPFSDTSSTALAWRIHHQHAAGWPSDGHVRTAAQRPSIPQRDLLPVRPYTVDLRSYSCPASWRRGSNNLLAISFCLYACNMFVLMPNKNYCALTLAACIEEQKVTGKH
jgi:hypothetical protein